MTMRVVPTAPYPDQVPGTSRLRKWVSIFRQPHYVQNFVQSIFDAVQPAGRSVRAHAAEVLAEIRRRTGMDAPTLIT
jgi:phosphoglucomutase